LRNDFHAQVIGVDPSQKMLEVARQKVAGHRVEFQEGTAEDVPLPDACADLVFLSMMVHHIADRPRAVREYRRVLRQGGRVCVRNSTRDSDYPQRRFFPGIEAFIESELPSRMDIKVMFEGAGLRMVNSQIVSHPLAKNWSELAEKLAMRADSFLARLPDTEFEHGMAALRAHARTTKSGDVVVDDIDFLVFAH
jgi:ubiquinone/menaquinone biosynthesis C-methylase UbiE